MIRTVLFTAMCIVCFGCSSKKTVTGKGTISYTDEGKTDVVEFSEVKAEPGDAFLTIWIPFQKNCVFNADRSLSTEKYGEHKVVHPGTCTLFSDSGERGMQISSGIVNFQEGSLSIQGAGNLEGDREFKYDGPNFRIEFEGTY